MSAREAAREIAGFRGLAALSTVLFHVWQQYYRYDAQGAHPPVGHPVPAALISLEVIDFFFVISAYLLTLSYARAALDGQSVRPARVFLFRRAVRILPLYFLAVLVVWSIRNPTFPGDWRDLVGHLTFTHVLDQRRIFYTLGPTWSLSLEVVFYGVLVLLGPLAVRACRGVARRRNRAALCLTGCLTLFVLPLVWLAVARYGLGVPHTQWVAYFGPQARFGGFAAGMLLAVLTTALGDRGKLPAPVATGTAIGAAGGLFWLSFAGSPENFAFTFYHPLASLLWAVLLLGTVHVARRPRWQGALRARWLTGTGLISYSLFIWHEPVMLQLHAAGLLPAAQAGFPVAVLITFVVAVPVAVASYWLIEYPASLLARLRDGRGGRRDFYPGSPGPATGPGARPAPEAPPDTRVSGPVGARSA